MQFTETVTRTITEISDERLLSEYESRGTNGPPTEGERGLLRAEIQRRMAERYTRQCYCGQLNRLGIGNAR